MIRQQKSGLGLFGFGSESGSGSGGAHDGRYGEGSGKENESLSEIHLERKVIEI